MSTWATEMLEGNNWIDELLSYDVYCYNRNKGRKLNIGKPLSLEGYLKHAADIRNEYCDHQRGESWAMKLYY